MSASNPIRVLIVDDHGMVRRGLAAFLRVFADLELVGEARNGRQAIQMCEQVQPDVILMDLVMPKCAGQPTLASEAASVLVQITSQEPPSGYGLTPHGREVLALMVTRRATSQRPNWRTCWTSLTTTSSKVQKTHV